jgi:hypothetical protein
MHTIKQKSFMHILLLGFLLLFIQTTLQANALADQYLEKIKKHPDLTFHDLIKKKLYPLKYQKERDDNSEIESVFIEVFTDNDQTAIKIGDTSQHEYFIATKKYALAIYNVDNGFFKYAVLFKPDGTVDKVLLLTYRFGNNNFHVNRDYKMGIGKNITFMVEEKRYDKAEGKEALSYQEKYFLTLKPDAKFTVKHIREE